MQTRPTSTKQTRSRSGSARPRSTGQSRWHLFALGSLSVFLLGLFLLGDAATSPSAVVELRLATQREAPLTGASDPADIATDLASHLRPDPTRDSSELSPAVNPRLELLKYASISVDDSGNGAPVVRIVWSAEQVATLRLQANSSQDVAASFTNAGHAFAQVISEQARGQANLAHTASSKLLDETTHAIDRLEQNLQELLERKLHSEHEVSPVSYQSGYSSPAPTGSSTVQAPRRHDLLQPGLLLNDFAEELAAIQDAEILRDLLIQLKGNRERMLLHKTERHPDVLNLKDQISYVEKRLNELPITPLTIQNNNVPRVQDVSAGMTSADAEGTERVEELLAQLQSLQKGQESLFSEWRSRMMTLSQLKQERNQQLQAERSALELCVQLADAELATVESVELNREIVPARWGLIAGFLVFGAVIAGGSLAGWGTRCASTFASVDDVRKSIAIPLVGTVASTELDSVPAAARSRRLFRLATFACEMFLVVTVLWIIVLAIADVEYRALLLESPLTALLETCARSWQLLLG